jgi:hypothetical protein
LIRQPTKSAHASAGSRSIGEVDLAHAADRVEELLIAQTDLLLEVGPGRRSQRLKRDLGVRLRA